MELIGRCPQVQGTKEASAEVAGGGGSEKHVQVHSGKGMAKSQKGTAYKDRHTCGTWGTDNEARWRMGGGMLKTYL